MVLQKDGVRQGNYLLLKEGFCPPRFLLPQQALFLQSWRWGDVGHVFFCVMVLMDIEILSCCKP